MTKQSTFFRGKKEKKYFASCKIQNEINIAITKVGPLRVSWGLSNKRNQVHYIALTTWEKKKQNLPATVEDFPSHCTTTVFVQGWLEAALTNWVRERQCNRISSFRVRPTRVCMMGMSIECELVRTGGNKGLLENPFPSHGAGTQRQFEAAFTSKHFARSEEETGSAPGVQNRMLTEGTSKMLQCWPCWCLEGVNSS